MRMPKTNTYTLSEIDSKVLDEIASKIKTGAIAVIPTDTIYGIVGVAKNAETVERIYKLRKRASSKPMIILISSIEQIEDLGLKLNETQLNIFKQIWPNKISVVIDCPIKDLHYLHRGQNSIAFRMPDDKFLKNLLAKTGPIVAPSANFEGEKPSENIENAKKYFGDNISIYIDGGTLTSKPSTVAVLKDSKLQILREGAVEIPKSLQ